MRGEQAGFSAIAPLLEESIMKSTRLISLATATLLGSTGFASADGQLNIFNWEDYISPELIEKFEKEHSVTITMTEYESNEAALAKVRPGARL